MFDDSKYENITWEWNYDVPPEYDKAKVFFIDEEERPTTKDKAKAMIVHWYKDGKIVLYSDPPRNPRILHEPLGANRQE